MSISAVILTKNEEKNIERCIQSVSFCDEIVVVDDYSTDKTLELIKKSKIKNQNDNLKFKIFERELNGDFAAQRNFGLSKAKGDWVLFVDADEIVSLELADEITNYLSLITNHLSGFFLKRHDNMWEKELKYGDLRNFKELRLAKKTAGKWSRKVHEVWGVKGKIGEMDNPLIHYAHPNLWVFTSKINFYSTLHAEQKFEDGEKLSLLKIILWPKLKFLKDYFLKLGFLDGTEGLVLAVMMSFHSFLAWSKLWLTQNKKV
ncbi:glycosyltransferase family 2 protein [Candidatus Microgenomates bacterium]|nr:glycosyltransferase family 2 protein [Candidatus Microgenomates bacterium]